MRARHDLGVEPGGSRMDTPATRPDPRVLHVHEGGTPGSPVVVFLHGAGSSGRMWHQHVARLGDRFRCLAPDLPGFGASRAVAPLSRLDTTALVAAMIEDRAPGERVHVVGLSWGGAIAHTLLATRPELLDRVVIDGAGLLTSRRGGAMLAGVRAVSPFLHTRPVIGLFSRLIGMDEDGRDDLRSASPRAFRRAFVEGFHPVVSPVELAAGSPTLLVAGEAETAVRPSNAGQAALMPDALAVHVPGGGHGWAARRLPLHVAMVEAWLTDAPLPAGLVEEPPSPAAVARLRREAGGARSDADHRPAPRPRPG
jgi:pimeloyl-ACP methyl ester carboxylesterase